jgi:hypothetical protein
MQTSKSFRPVLRLGVLLTLTYAAAFAVSPGQGKLSGLRTRPERTNYEETSRYDDVVEFMRAVAAVSPRVHLTTFGYTFEGRALPLAVVGNVKDARPESVRAAGKTRVYIQGNIHAGEVEGKEAMQELLRSLAAGEHAPWLSSMVLLIAPIYNADGNERINLTNRPAQNGPIGGMGQRANAQNLDLNRDHMKLESPEARSLVRLLALYDPHVSIDLHTTDGTRHAYHLTYEPPMNPNTDPGIVDLLRRELLPAVSRAIKEREGWDIFYYGNLPWRGSNGERGWYASDHLARYGHSYIGLRNRLAILSEAYAYLTFEERIRVTRRFVEEILNYVQSQGEQIRKVTAEADKLSVVGKPLALRAGYEKLPQPIEVLMGDVLEERNPYTGAIMLRRLNVKKPETLPFYGVFAPTETERAPRAYLVPPSLRRVVERLEAHGIQSLKLEKPARLKLEQYKIASSTVSTRAYQGHQERTLTGAWDEVEQEVPAGTLAIPVDQPLGRLVFMLLEPRSEDGFTAWNLLDDVLEKAILYPITRTFGELPQQKPAN